MDRRQALKRIACGLFALPLSRTARAAPLKPLCSGRLSFYNPHSRESLTVDYLRPDKRFDTAAVNRLNHLFRCHFDGRVHPIDPRLFLLLDAVHQRLGAGRRPFQLISGFRSPAYNRLLRQKSAKVAAKSFHLLGKAADVRIAGIGLSKLRRAGRDLQVGGVGTYSDFIHLDTGPVRHW